MNRIGVPLLLAVLLPAAAHAQLAPCPSGPNVVAILAADTQVNVLKALGAKLATVPITIVYTPNGSCTNIANMYKGANGTWLTNGSASVVNADGTSTVCDATGITTPDLAISIVFPDNASCPTAPAKPATIGITQGPVQAFVWAAPGAVGGTTGSTQKSITAEEAYLVAGLGPTAAMVTPWTDPTFFIGRTATKGTQVSIGANIGVAAGVWKLTTANKIDQSNAVADAIANATDPEATLGILGVEIYDATTTGTTPNRSRLHSLSYRHFGQYKSYWPDSSPSTFNKQNVRDGHYPLWSYVQYLAVQKPSPGVGAVKDATQTIIDLFTGKTPAGIDFDPLPVMIGNFLVPACAMKVQRFVEGGPITPTTQTDPCSCFYEKNVSGGSTSCTACTDNSMCSGGTTCHHGYCEAQ
jgi:hypothetical protein